MLASKVRASYRFWPFHYLSNSKNEKIKKSGLTFDTSIFMKKIIALSQSKLFEYNKIGYFNLKIFNNKKGKR